MPSKPEFKPQEKELAMDLRDGKCCIFTGAGVASAIIHIDPIISEANAKTIRSTVGSWAGFLRAVATQFFRTYSSSQILFEDIDSLFGFGCYIDVKITQLFKENKDKSSAAFIAVEDAIFDRKEFLQNELFIQNTDDKKRLVSEINIEIQRIKFIIDRVYNAFPQKENKMENDFLDLIKNVALIPWGKCNAITKSTELLKQLINKTNESLGYIPCDNLWQRGSMSVKHRIDELEQNIIDCKNEEAKEKLKHFKNHYTELKTLFEKFSGSTEKSEYTKEFIKDFQLSLAGVISVNNDNLNKTFRHLTELVLSPLKSDQHAPLVKALNIICKNNVLLTSNYDTFLESALFRNALNYMEDLADTNQLNLLIPDDIARDSNLHNRFVIHVHGLYYDKGSFVISEDEYKKTTNLFVKFMKKLILEKKRSLVFIGVSADGWTDWHMAYVFRDLAYMKNTNSHPRHYWLVKRGTDFPNEDDFSELSNHEEQKITLQYVKKKVKIVEYGDSYDCLAPYLVYLSSYKPERPTSRKSLDSWTVYTSPTSNFNFLKV
ncbi:9582_t:CDS:2 [Dentiscutata erythropus]|uniref:9582_t:CDS:1 n=1 Tax=Dentiscutata erythropus TaxID=1348616 RepID=A0A9N9F479_9GLOM|nr:9582_t:CDS:2 [Dentiscutata erythropus]